MRVVVDKAQSRGYANHGWLKTHHTFSFANYYNPERVHLQLNRDGKEVYFENKLTRASGGCLGVGRR